MRQVILTLALFAAVAAQSDGNGGWFCNYTASGDEIVSNAVPIATFRTSGANQTRRGWCIAFCQDRTSLKATMLFQPSTGVSMAKYNRYIDRTDKGEKHVSFKQMKGFPQKLDENDDMFCTDQTVAATVDAVFDKYQGIDALTENLAKYVNKPGWAFLVFEMIPEASGIITTVNVFQDDNFCMKTMMQNVNGEYIEYQVFSGLVMS